MRSGAVFRLADWLTLCEHVRMNDSIRGSGRIGSNPWFGYRGIGFASLQVTPASLTFKLWPVSYTLDRHFVRGLVKKPTLGLSSFFVLHSNPDFPKVICFQPYKPAALESLLTGMGYPVMEREPDDFRTDQIQYASTISRTAYVAALLGFVAAIAALAAVFVAFGQ